VELAPSAEPVAPAPLPSAEVPLTAPPAEPPAPKAIAPGVSVRFADQSVFAIRVARAGRTVDERAAGVTKLLARAAVGAKGSDVKVQRKPDVAIIVVGQTPVVQLVAEDATAAGDTSLDVHAASVAAAIREAIDSERQRAAIANSVLSVSLLVFLGLVAFYLLQKVGEFAQRARSFIDEHGERVLAVRVRRIEVVSPGTVRSTAIVGLSVGKWIAQLAVVYLWLVYALSQFEATRGYTQRLTGLVLTPLSDLLARIAVGLPVLVVLVIAGFAVFVLVRFVGLFFSSVGRRENVVPWIPPDLVPPVSSLVRFGIVVAALLFIAPLITGTSESVLARSGWVIMFALGLAATPVLANGIAGAMVLFGRRLRAGQYLAIGDHHGRIATIGLLELCLEGEDGIEIRVPHLYTLFRPMRVSHAKIPNAGSRLP
jgi:small-conductance mechanosensitive channel